MNALSLTGAALGLSMVAAILIAARRGILPSLALPIGLFVFSLSTVAAISIARKGLGDWHLQYALPGVCSAYAASYLVCREVRSREAIASFVAAAVLLMFAPIAYYHAFYQYGPSYNAYIHSIERYARTYLANPAQKKPFPETGGWDLNATMVWFLASRDHPIFAGENKKFLMAARTPITGGRVDLTDNGIPRSKRSHLRVVATLPPNTIPDAVIAKISSVELVLRKTDPRLVAPVICGNACFSGWILAGRLPPGHYAVQLSTVRLDPGGG